MALDIHVGLDLGSDTLKIAYAYDYAGVKTGKMVGDPQSMTAIPAVAFYDFEENVWKYGEDVDRIGDKSFMGVVKIKSLLALLNGKNSPQVNESNKNAYFYGNDFPKFYFPERRKIAADFSKAVAGKRTFKVEGLTPSKLCENYFAYVGSLVAKRAALLAKKHRVKEFNIIPSVLYPQYTSKECVAELERLVTYGFGRTPLKVISMTKALCAYAMETKRIKQGESVLIFNMGEEQISVVKASLLKSGLAVDGADGHNDPADIGGNDIDDAISAQLESDMAHRESMGRPSAGEEGHMAEGSLNSKQYLFVKDIKYAKIILGMPLYKNKAFKKGVPVCVSRDLYIQRTLTRGGFVNCVGFNDDNGFAGKLIKYIDDEISRSINGDVTKIFLTGGPVETYGLVEYVKNKFASRNVGIYTFENDDSVYEGVKNDGFNILSYEDAIYAPAVGCALTAIKNIDIKTVLALSYGLRLFFKEKGTNKEFPGFMFLVNKGDILPPEGTKFFIPKPGEPGITNSLNSESSDAMPIMSTSLSPTDVDYRKYNNYLTYMVGASGKTLLYCDPLQPRVFNRLQTFAGFRVLNGDNRSVDNCRIYYRYRNARVMLVDKVYTKIGVSLNGEGRAKAFAENDVERNGYERTKIQYMEPVYDRGRLIKVKGEIETVYKKDVYIYFDIGEMIFS